MYHSESTDSSHRYGVGIIVSTKITQWITNVTPYSVTPYSCRIKLIQINKNKSKFVIIQVYAPMSDKPDNDIESFYEDLESVLKAIKYQEL